MTRATFKLLYQKDTNNLGGGERLYKSIRLNIFSLDSALLFVTHLKCTSVRIFEHFSMHIINNQK